MMEMLSAMHSRPDGSDGRVSKTVYVIEDDLTIVEATGWDCGPDNDGCWWIPDLGYTYCDVFFEPYDAIAERYKRVQIEQQRVYRLVFNEDGSPRDVAQQIRPVGDRRNKTQPTDGS